MRQMPVEEAGRGSAGHLRRGSLEVSKYLPPQAGQYDGLGITRPSQPVRLSGSIPR